MRWMFRPEQRAAAPGGAVHPDLFRWLRDLSSETRLVATLDKTADYDAAPGEVVLCNPTGGAFTVTLPKAVDVVGQLVIVKNNSSSSNVITVAAQTGDTVDGGANTTLAAGRAVVTLYAATKGVWVIL